MDALIALGWVHDEASPEELIVREGVYFSMKEVSSWRRQQHEKMQGVSIFCVCVINKSVSGSGRAREQVRSIFFLFMMLMMLCDDAAGAHY